MVLSLQTNGAKMPAATPLRLKVPGLTAGATRFIANTIDAIATTAVIAIGVGASLVADGGMAIVDPDNFDLSSSRAWWGGGGQLQVKAFTARRDARNPPKQLRKKNVFVGGVPTPFKPPSTLENRMPKKESTPIPVVLQDTLQPTFTAVAAPVILRAQAMIRAARTNCDCSNPNKDLFCRIKCR